MEKTFEAIQFIIDLFKFAENLKRRQKYDLDYYVMHCKFSFYHPGTTLKSDVISKLLFDFDDIDKNAQYIFYNILTQNFVLLKGSEIKKLKYWSPKSSILNVLENKETLNHILYWSYVTDRLEDLKKIADRIRKLDFTSFSCILNSYYSLFNKTAKTRLQTSLLLLDFKIKVKNANDIEYYINNQVQPLLSLYIYLKYDYYNSCNDGKFLNECRIRNFVEYILNRFNRYKHLRKSTYFDIYPSFIANADGRQCSASIYINFEIDDPFKLLLAIEALGIIDKI